MKIREGDVVRILECPSPIAWWNWTIGQMSQVLGVYEPTGFIHVRLHLPTYWENALDSHYQIDGWMDEKFVELLSRKEVYFVP